MLRHGSLFSGIGGFDLAAEWAGWENVFHCEWNPFGQRVLKHYWPNAESFNDITKSDFTKYEHSVDIISGGFPCQPFSTAGKQRGTDDTRYLWPAMLDVIRTVKPKYVVGENVYGLVVWNQGLVFDTICTDLEIEGYEVQSFLLPAAGVNAPHKRNRIWFVARRVATDADGDGFNQRNGGNEIKSSQGGFDALRDAHASDGDGNATDASCERQERWNRQIVGQVPAPHGVEKFNEPTKWETFPTQPPICSGNDGVPDQLDGITFSKWRNESLKAYGNAIVPQVALQIFNAINDYEND